MFYLGIDGGGTKTKATLANELGEVLGVGFGGPSSIRTVSKETTRKSIKDAIRQAINNQNLVLSAVFAGLGDIESDEDKEFVEAIIKSLDVISDSTKVKVESDVYNALYGGLAGIEKGVSVIIGTGSVAFGTNGTSFERVGGYSYKEGDPGSSFYLGRHALWHVSRVLDGRSKETNFSKELFDVLNITNRVSYVERLDEYYNDRTKTAQLAKLVTKHGELEDEYAMEIVVDSVKGIVEIINTCANKLKLVTKNVAVIGSLGNHPYYFNIIKQVLKKIDNNYELFPSILDPSMGAVIGAYHLDEVMIKEEHVKSFKQYNLCEV